MCSAVLLLVSDITGTKCAEVLFLGTASVGTRWCAFDRCSGSDASHPSTPPHLQDSAADVQQKKKGKNRSLALSLNSSCEPHRPMHHFRFNHWKLLISLGEQQPLCRGEGTLCLSGCLSKSRRKCATLSQRCRLHCVVDIIGGETGSQEAGVYSRFGHHSVGHRVDLRVIWRNVFSNGSRFHCQIVWSQLKEGGVYIKETFSVNKFSLTMSTDSLNELSFYIENHIQWYQWVLGNIDNNAVVYRSGQNEFSS